MFSLMYFARVPLFASCGMKESQFSAALPNTNNNFFIVVRSVPSSSTVLFAADIGFIHFDSTVQHGLVYLFHAARMRWQRYHAVL